MTWKSPEWLWALIALPLVVAGLVWWAKDRRRAVSAYADPRILNVGPTRRTRVLRAVAAVLALLSLVALTVAMARPSIDRTKKENRSNIIIAIDTSKSMQKTDISPSRLQAGVAAARKFLQVAPKDAAIGLVTFSNGSRVRVSPVTDRAAVSNALNNLPIGVGTAIGDALIASLSSLQGAGALSHLPPSSDQSPARILLLTDGANSAGSDPAAAAQRAKALRVPVYTMLLGDDQGRPDQLSPQETLSNIANTTGGIFTRSTTASDLKRVFSDIGSSIASERKLEELTAVFVLIALGLLVAAGGVLLISEVRPPRQLPRTI
ncbi:MAG TPA: VWA domain-containing protein [Miltoncostaeaceae bacterium]|nr:VWA domain-containing protein [Miltoncostaeaceae bacterium]